MILGLIQALAIFYEFKTKKARTHFFSKYLPKQKVILGRLFTYLFYGFSLIFFFAGDLSVSLKALSSMNNLSFQLRDQTVITPLIFGLSFAIVFLLYEYLQNSNKKIITVITNLWNRKRLLRIIVYYLTVFMIISQLSGNTSFIYEMF
jgi:hypothetical protein